MSALNSRRRPLVVAVAQPVIVSHDVEGNARRHAAVILEAHADLVVFPELSLSGYELGADPIDPGSPQLGVIVDACRTTGATALAGAPVREGTSEFIAMLAFDPAGAAVVYRKMWLGADEAKRFSPGPAPVVLAIAGWRCGLAVCKDTGIVQHAGDTAALGIDVYVAGVVEDARDAAVTEQRARRVARDHEVFVAVSSFAGPTGEGYVATAGGSGIWNRAGDALGRAGVQAGAVVKAELG